MDTTDDPSRGGSDMDEDDEYLVVRVLLREYEVNGEGCRWCDSKH